MKKLIFFFIILIANTPAICQLSNKIVAKQYRYRNNSSEEFLPADFVKAEGYVFTFKNMVTIYDGEMKMDVILNEIAYDTTANGKTTTIYKVTDGNKTSCLLIIVDNPTKEVDFFSLKYDRVLFTWAVEH
jgi:hypothetical protein